MTQSREPEVETVILDVEKIANQFEVELLQAVLVDNETAYNFISPTIQGLKPTYLFKDIDGLTEELRDKYKDSYIYTVNPIKLFYVNDDGSINPVLLNQDDEKQLAATLPLLQEFNVANDVEPLDKQLDNYINIEIKPPADLNDEKATERVAAIAAKQAAAIGAKKALAKAYPFKHAANAKPIEIVLKNKKYNVYLKQNLLRREAKQKGNEPARYNYESYNPAAFYIGANNIRTLHKSTGVLKLTTDPKTKESNLAISTKHQRVVKIEHHTWVTEAQKEQLRTQIEDQYKHVFSKMNADKNDESQINLGFKKTEIIEGNGITDTYSVMAFLDGVSLDNKIREAQLDQEAKKFLMDYRLEIIDLALQSLQDRIHKNNDWVHCDIKPGNFVMLYDENNDDLKIQIIDFDDTRFPGSTTRPTGTKAYLSPEISNATSKDLPFTQSSDSFAMGLTMMSLYLGQKITNENYQQELSNIDHPALRFILQTMLAQDPSKRLSINDALTLQRSPPNRFDIMGSVLQSVVTHIEQNPNWIHGNIQPSNFIFKQDGETPTFNVQIIDANDTPNAANNKKYFAPEVKSTNNTKPAFNQAADVFAMGLTLMNIYCGKEITNDNYKQELAKIENVELTAFFQTILNENPDLRMPLEGALILFQGLRPEFEKGVSSTATIFSTIGTPQKNPQLEITKQPSPDIPTSSKESPIIVRQEMDSPKPASSSPGPRRA